MGNCRSCETRRRSILTAKLILVGGQLQEFVWPVKVSLLSAQDSGCIICSAEEMEFGDFPAAMGADEALQPGEIYFELPPSWRNVRLQAEDMAALALKASVALESCKSRDDDRDDDGDRILSCCCFCRSRRVGTAVVVFSEEKEMPLLGGGGRGGGNRGGGAMAGGKFVRRLSAIVED